MSRTAIPEQGQHFEHRLLLSATPHNGYPESFTALLELLAAGAHAGPQRAGLVRCRRPMLTPRA